MADIARWQPDIVLMQEVFPYQANLLATLLYGGKGDFRSHETNGVVTRWKIVREFHSAAKRDEQLTVEMPGGRQIQIVNVHLATAATDLRLWRRSAWAEHRQNRLVRRNELDLTLTTLRSTTQFPEVPTLFGGDFNSPASDVVHRQLSGDFVDAFAKAGTGWGDTFQHRFPILRIDHIYATRQFTAVRCRVVNTRNSDHRMVVADFVLE